MIAESVFKGSLRLEVQPKSYDWLGHGIYFWENSPERALQWAKEKKKRSTGKGKDDVTTPAVVGAVIDLGYSLNLLDARALEVLKKSHQALRQICDAGDIQIPENKAPKGRDERVLHNLDCAVIEFLHQTRASREELREYDSVRGVFVEGDKLYKGAEFNERNHIQICVRNPNCIKGYFRVLEYDAEYAIP